MKIGEFWGVFPKNVVFILPKQDADFLDYEFLKSLIFEGELSNTESQLSVSESQLSVSNDFSQFF